MSRRNLEGQEKAIRLRVEERKSLSEIHDLTGLSKSSLSAWLKAYPLTAEEKAARHRGKICLSRRKNRGEMSKFYEMAQGHEFSTSEKGAIAETAIKLRLLVNGFKVYISPDEGDKIDFLTLDPSTGRILKVQVKWARQEKDGLPVIRVRCSNGRGKSRSYQEGEFDFLVGYDFYSDTAYVFSFDDVKGMQSVSVREDAKERWNKLRN